MSVGTGVPVKLYEILIPVLLNLLDELIKQSNIQLSNVIRKQIESAISDASPCNDLELQTLINNINKLKQRLTNFESNLDKISLIANILITIGTTAQAISLYLTISGTPVAPAGLVKAISIITALGINASSVSKLLISILEQISLQLNVVSVQMNQAINVVNALCPEKQVSLVAERKLRVIDTDNGFVNNSVNAQVSTSSNVATSTSNIIPDSVFYRDVNVSDSDLENRLADITELLNNQLDVVTGIKESPSNVLSGTQNPTSADGYPGDYFINLSNGDIFGPKTANNMWN
jgi:hypothetical protein